ncbi:MAG: segregation/condensation protein A [Eubacteriales bacterium]|nr:segregation/condensation protein A [Eubacteriales bacterium]
MENPNFHLEGVLKEKDGSEDFEGPLSLILMLLSKNKIEIRDIKIADILDQYLDYLAQMESMDLEIASEFIQMAAYLLYIKTRMLLTNDEEESSELEMLIASLEQLKAKDTLASIRKNIPELKTLSQKGLLYFAKQPEPLRPFSGVYEYRHECADLLKALYAVFSRGVKPTDTQQLDNAIPHRIVYSIKDKSRQILELLHTGDIRLRELYGMCETRSELVAAFMSVLELCSMGAVSFERTDNDYSLHFSGGEPDEIIEKISE